MKKSPKLGNKDRWNISLLSIQTSLFLRWLNLNRFLVKSFAGPIIPVLNDAIEKEYREVLSRPKFHLPADLIEDVVQTFRQKGLYVNAETLDVAFSDPKDVVFFEVVMETRKNEDAWLVTGNAKHFPTVPFVVTPRQMLDIILRDQEHLS